MSEDLEAQVRAEVWWHGERNGATSVIHGAGDVDPHFLPYLLPVLEVKTTNKFTILVGTSQTWE